MKIQMLGMKIVKIPIPMCNREEKNDCLFSGNADLGGRYALFGIAHTDRDTALGLGGLDDEDQLSVEEAHGGLGEGFQ